MRQDDAEQSPPAPVSSPAIGPEVEAPLRAILAMMPADRGPLTVEQLPLLRSAMTVDPPSNADLTRSGAFEVREVDVPALGDAPDVRLLVCLPTRTPVRRGCVVWIHGGGMVAGSPRDGLAELLGYAESLDLAVVSVDYRLAPETRHPGPVEDCYAAISWAGEHLGELGVAPDGLVVAGSSAGGGLAAGAVLMARDRGGPSVRGLMLQSPMLDHRNASVSMQQAEGGTTWDRHANAFGWACLLGPDADPKQVSGYASPARMDDLSGMPSTYLDVGSADGFRDEGAHFALRLAAAGSLTELHIWPGGYHGFENLAPHAAVSRAALSARRSWLEQLLEHPIHDTEDHHD